MTFIASLIALIIERFFHWSHLRRWQWFMNFQHFLTTRFAQVPKSLLLVVAILPPLLIIVVVNYLLSGWGYSVPKLLFGLAVLVYCLGPKNLWVEIYACIKALHDEDTTAAMEQIKTAFGITAVDQPQLFHQAFTRAIFIAANQRIFAVMFWFALLGPAGAFLYRAITLCATSESSTSQSAWQIQHILDWIPVRVLTFLFALGGHFMAVFARWKHDAKQGLDSNEKMLGDCGIAALDVREGEALPEEGTAEKQALALLDRTFVLGLVILAMVVLMS